MNEELIAREGNSIEQGRQDRPLTIMEVIARAAADPRVDTSKMKELLEMQIRVEQRQAEVEFNEALARILPKMPRIQKNGAIYDRNGKLRSTYAKYEEIDAIIRPLLAEEGFSMGFTTDDSVKGYLRVTGTLRHRMGHKESSSFTVPTENAVITGAQAVGAADSLARRYIMLNTFNIICVDADTDGVEVKTIGAEQVLTLETLLQDSKADRTKFFEWAHVGKLEEISEPNYDKCLKALQERLRKQQEQR